MEGAITLSLAITTANTFDGDEKGMASRGEIWLSSLTPFSVFMAQL